tara:strand:+ start:11006 stop:11626 length:621 start_codon:yes stop_codon:yes gene_type:complete
MARKYFKDSREGKERHTWCVFGDFIDEQADYAIEITREEYAEIERNKVHQRRIDNLLPSNQSLDKDGDIPLSDIGKLMYYSHNHYKAIDLNYRAGNDDEKINLLKEAISENIEIPPIKAYYNSILDKWFSADGFHRICAYHSLDMAIPYKEHKEHYYIESTKDHIENYREEKELIELGELSDTTLSEADYKSILKEKNDILKNHIQ